MIKSFRAPGLSIPRVESNTTVTFTCEARGAAPLMYVWIRDGTVILQEGSSTLKVEKVIKSGEYSCCVENEFGSETSKPIKLVVGKSNNCLHVCCQIPAGIRIFFLPALYILDRILSIPIACMCFDVLA